MIYVFYDSLFRPSHSSSFKSLTDPYKTPGQNSGRSYFILIQLCIAILMNNKQVSKRMDWGRISNLFSLRAVKFSNGFELLMPLKIVVYFICRPFSPFQIYHLLYLNTFKCIKFVKLHIKTCELNVTKKIK